MTMSMRYRDFIADLEADAAEDDMMRVLENRYLAETCDIWLSLVPGRDGGVALIRSRKLGKAPTDADRHAPVRESRRCRAAAQPHRSS